MSSTQAHHQLHHPSPPPWQQELVLKELLVQLRALPVLHRASPLQRHSLSCQTSSPPPSHPHPSHPHTSAALNSTIRAVLGLKCCWATVQGESSHVRLCGWEGVWRVEVERGLQTQPSTCAAGSTSNHLHSLHCPSWACRHGNHVIERKNVQMESDKKYESEGVRV